MDAITSFINNIDTSIILGIKICLIAIMGDTAITWLLSFVKGEFDLRKAPQFIKTNVLPYVGGLLIIAFLAIVDSDYMAVFAIVTTAITAKFGVEVVKDKIVGFFKSEDIETN